MTRPTRPNVDVKASLDNDEWLELYHESLRASSFWPRIVITAVTLVAAIGVTTLFGASTTRILNGMAAALGMVITYTTAYVWLAPRLRCRRLTDQARTAHWRISAEQLWADVAGLPVDLAWRDITQVRVTRRLVTFELTDGHSLLTLPRRSATELGETLILGWATDNGTPITRRP